MIRNLSEHSTQPRRGRNAKTTYPSDRLKAESFRDLRHLGLVRISTREAKAEPRLHRLLTHTNDAPKNLDTGGLRLLWWHVDCFDLRANCSNVLCVCGLVDVLQQYATQRPLRSDVLARVSTHLFTKSVHNKDNKCTRRV